MLGIMSNPQTNVKTLGCHFVRRKLMVGGPNSLSLCSMSVAEEACKKWGG